MRRRPFLLLVLGLLVCVPAGVRADEKQPADAANAQRIATLRATWSEQQQAYLAIVAEARKELDAAKSRFEQSKDAAEFQQAIHLYHWAITRQSALGPWAETYKSLRELHLHEENGKRRATNEACWRIGLEGTRWLDQHVWGNLVEPVVPAGPIERGYLRKQPIKVLMAGDSITEYMDPGVTMLDHLDSRFQVLGHGLAGHSISSWFTNGSTPACLAWNPDVIVIMLGTNGTTQAMQDDATKRGHRDEALQQYAEDLLRLRELPSKPQVILVTVPAQGPGLWFQAAPAMWELQSHIAREHRFPLIDMTRGLAGLLSDLPNGHTYCPNRKTAGRWTHSFDDAHTSLGPAMAKYYGLVCRQVLEPERWYELNLRTTAVESPDWQERWLIAQCVREPQVSPDRATGFQRLIKDGVTTVVEHQNRIARGKANGEVSFLRPGRGGDFYLMRGRTHQLTFGRPYQILSDTPPATGFPARYGLGGTIRRGDGQAAAGIVVTCGDRTVRTDATGQFSLTDLAENITTLEITISTP